MKATVAILTFNGEQYLEKVLKMCFRQETSFDYEVLVIDSGSTDNTLKIIRKFPHVRLHKIPNSQFGHGKTRNLAASLAKGEIVAYLTQDAVPANKHWLEQLVNVFDVSDKIAGVFGKQIPHKDCCATVKKEIIEAFSQFGPAEAVMISRRNPLVRKRGQRDALTFYSDVNSALRKSVWEEVPYRNLSYAEDQAFGQDMIKAGYYKAYAPFAAVIHSHNYPLFKYLRRKYDETVGLRQSIGKKIPIGKRELTLGVIKGTIHEWKFIIRDKDYGVFAKLKWLWLAPFYNLFRRLAIKLGGSTRLSSKVKNFFSLETNQRKDNK